MLADFIEKTRCDPFEWGQNDCAMWCASAVAHETGFDPAEDLRGTYASGFECRRIIMTAGGLVPLIAPRMDLFAFSDLESEGVAVLKLDGRQLCGLVIDGRGVVRTQSGLRIIDEISVLRGWSW